MGGAWWTAPVKSACSANGCRSRPGSTPSAALSAHADLAGLLAWLGAFKRPPGRTFVAHGEHASALEFAETIRTTLHWPNVTVPVRGDVPLFA